MEQLVLILLSCTLWGSIIRTMAPQLGSIFLAHNINLSFLIIHCLTLHNQTLDHFNRETRLRPYSVCGACGHKINKLGFEKALDESYVNADLQTGYQNGVKLVWSNNE